MGPEGPPFEVETLLEQLTEKNVARRMRGKLKNLHDVLDVGLLVGSQERRDGLRLARELKALVDQVDRMEGALRIARREASHGQS